MANWLLDYIEMTEYIPAELREQLTSIRELDLQVHNAMDELEKDIRQFFSNIDTLTSIERQEQYEALLKKCDVATRAAGDKVKVADKLHDLVEKSMRLLDQGLEKLKEELLEGDKAYIVEDLERRSQELDEQIRLEHENMSQRSISKTQALKSQLKGSNNNHHHHQRLSSIDSSSSKSNQLISQSNHRNSMPAQTNNNTNLHSYHQNTNHRSRNNSTGTQNSAGTQKKRERKRLNSAMTIFNRNSRIDDEDSTTSQSFISSPMTPDYLVSMQNSSKSLNDVVAGGNNCSLTLKGMVTGNRITIGANDKSNGKDPLAGAKQPILTAIDAAHAVSPNATNSDKLVLFSNNANGDNYDGTIHHNHNKQQIQNNLGPLSANHPHPQAQHLHNHNQLSNHLLSKVGYSSGDSTSINNSMMPSNKGDALHSHRESSNHKTSNEPFSNLPLSSRHDPIMMAASQAINATQNMTSGRRTSSLKASYAAVNSGRLQTSAPGNHQLFEPGVGLVHEVYCKCRSHIQGSDMIACDNSKCKIEWFHWECVGITTPPEGEWYCDECRASLGVHTQRSNKQPKLEGVNVT